ncbi:adhesin [Streptomyces sp. CA-210063]|uniref:ScbA/BarX family gamma-butyrolactone biosynthesis protein n=1 Tax=Streptomyces sp. CA-210063 TaxID=2801029 RepID=UPI00214B0586|nr:ScbA/BarX family gamma-butyrolactone biosynthesis protein [Streptomyces sp. CA-210063]UUU30226.1 adhesin [Streptomyces sp. CA-210063]
MCHRVRADDAFTTGWTELAQDRFLVRAHWPATHPFFSPVQGGHDPLLVVETMRQSAMAIVHAAYGAPLDHRFLLTTLAYTCVPGRNGVRAAGNEVDLLLTMSELRRGGGQLARLRVDWVVERDGLTVATGTGRARLISPQVYRRLRGEQIRPIDHWSEADHADPDLVGRSRAQDVLIAPTALPDAWELRADTRHPVLFQRPNDHIPGMLLLEAARQAASAATAPVPFVPTRGSIVFHRYAEFAGRCLLKVDGEVTPQPESAVRVVGLQDGSPVFESAFVSTPA